VLFQIGSEMLIGGTFGTKHGMKAIDGRRKKAFATCCGVNLAGEFRGGGVSGRAVPFWSGRHYEGVEVRQLVVSAGHTVSPSFLLWGEPGRVQPGVWLFAGDCWESGITAAAWILLGQALKRFDHCGGAVFAGPLVADVRARIKSTSRWR
jgi:hypothetical protein